MLENFAALTPGAFYRYAIRPDGDHYFVELGDRIEQFVGVDKSELLKDANLLFNRLPSEHQQELFQRVVDSAQQQAEFHYVFSVERPDGKTVWLEARSTPELKANGDVLWTGFVYDVTARERATEKLNSHLSNVNHVLNNMHDAIITTDAHGKVLYLNQSAEELLGFQLSELKGENIKQVMPQHHKRRHDNYMASYRETRQAQIIGSTRSVEVVSKSQEYIPVELRICEYVENGALRFMGTLRDLRPTIASKEALDSLRSTDPLTGLKNRSALLSHITYCLNAPTSKTSGHYCLLSLDVDDFRFINEGFGVNRGDDVLVEIGQRLQRVAADAICIARIQEDEFGILINGVQNRAQVEAYYERLKDALQEPIDLGKAASSIRLSAGACLLVSSDMTSMDVLHHCEVALGTSKQRSRGGLSFYEASLGDSYRSSALIDQKLKSPYLLSELFLEFQPQMQADGIALGYEALLRWRSDGDLIRPDEFIPIAERNGAIVTIGEWLIEQACQFLLWHQRTFPARETRLSINISPVQFQQANFVQIIAEAVKRTGIDARFLHLELTERLLIESTDHIVEKMSALSALGITFSLDDFGTGYSSLGYLSRLPLAELKIDKSFVRNLEPTSSNYRIVEAIILLSQSLGLNVIAEGVETEAELALLKRLGCVYYQGYYFGRPVAREQLTAPQMG